MKREYYSDSIADFLASSPETILGKLARENAFALEQSQREAWLIEIDILKAILPGREGKIYFEYDIPRMGRRIDVVLLIGPVIFVLEFKVGETTFPLHARDQVMDYALDLKNFHESSHAPYIAPVLIATNARHIPTAVALSPANDKTLYPIDATPDTLATIIDTVLDFADDSAIDPAQWEAGRYCPTPTIIEAARALFNGHNVQDILRNDALGENLTCTTDTISAIIQEARDNARKAICFVTGVPGAGKTLVGLQIANSHSDHTNELYSVFLSGNGPLVTILREALARDKVQREKEQGNRLRKGEALTEVKALIQNVHHFRDECLRDDGPPIEHVALFDEAQRAWNRDQTVRFMRTKKKVLDFDRSEPEFLISCLDRHRDWGVVVCLVGGGQEINTGEAGIGEWIVSLERSFPDWTIYLSSRLTDSEYAAGTVLQRLAHRPNVTTRDELHLAVSMRSFRAEHVSLLVKQILDLDTDAARATLRKLDKYPIVLTRSVQKAKAWLKAQARGTERYGIVVSSQAERLRPHAIHVKAPMNPIHWFLNDKHDVRSSYYLEDVATEFDVQGLELDWACITWDADFRWSKQGWNHWSFRGSRWQRILKEQRQTYLKNAYRVLLTRARQGMVIVVPEGDHEDPTRSPGFYDPSFEYLQQVGFDVI